MHGSDPDKVTCDYVQLQSFASVRVRSMLDCTGWFNSSFEICISTKASKHTGTGEPRQRPSAKQAHSSRGTQVSCGRSICDDQMLACH